MGIKRGFGSVKEEFMGSQEFKGFPRGDSRECMMEAGRIKGGANEEKMVERVTDMLGAVETGIFVFRRKLLEKDILVSKCVAIKAEFNNVTELSVV